MIFVYFAVKQEEPEVTRRFPKMYFPRYDHRYSRLAYEDDPPPIPNFIHRKRSAVLFFCTEELKNEVAERNNLKLLLTIPNTELAWVPSRIFAIFKRWQGLQGHPPSEPPQLPIWKSSEADLENPPLSQPGKSVHLAWKSKKGNLGVSQTLEIFENTIVRVRSDHGANEDDALMSTPLDSIDDVSDLLTTFQQLLHFCLPEQGELVLTLLLAIGRAESPLHLLKGNRDLINLILGYSGVQTKFLGKK